MDTIGFYGGFLELLKAVNENTFTYVQLTMIVLAIYFIFFKKQIYSIFDPFCITIFSSAIVTCNVLFMYSFDLISWNKEENLICFLITELAFFIGVLSIKPISTDRICKIERRENQSLLDFTYYNFAVFFILIQGISIFIIGLPVFSEGSRLAFYSGGTGIIAILSKTLFLVVFFLLCDRYFYGSNKSVFGKIFDIIVFFAILISVFGSGAKSGVLRLVTILFFYRLFCLQDINREELIGKMKKNMWGMFVLAFIAAGLVIFLQGNNDLESIFNVFLIRIVGFGDMVAFWYNTDFTSTIQYGNYFVDSLAGYLAAFRIIDYSELKLSEYQPIGTQIVNFFSHVQVYAGPNPRHNIIGLVYFGVFGAVIHSFIIGVMVSYVRNYLFNCLRSHIFKYIIYVQLCLYVCAVPFEGFFASGFSGLFYAIIIDGILFIFIYAIYCILKRRKE